MRWAFEQTGLRSPVKFVLVALADRADENNQCFPSREQLQLDTSMNKETISKATEELEKAGLVIKERRFNGSTVYRLVGVPLRHQSAEKPVSRKAGSTVSRKAGSTVSRKAGSTVSRKTRHQSAGKPAIDEPESRLLTYQSTTNEPKEERDALPVGLNVCAWGAWMQYLRARRKTPTAHTIELQHRRLLQHSEAVQREMIDAAIEAGWQSFYPPKGSGGKAATGTRARSLAEDLTDRSWA
jgi:DNA-binding transcriptional ArsR family regulator